MSTKLQFYSEFADRTARQITGSYRAWTSFLATAARLYKYPYNEQLMIYAQRPNATACAEYDFWKDRMGRYVQRGSTGIALIDTSGYQPRLRYVFDVADTAPRDAARSFTLWEMRTEHEAAVSAMLNEQYDVPQDGGIIAQFERVADKLALEYWTEQKRDICDIVADSFLNGYDEDNIRMTFKTAASTSITYALMTRCGFSPDSYFEPEDFMPVFDFNTPAAVSVLGTAVSEISQRVLRQIEITVKRHERERRAERTEEHGEQPDLQDQRRISDSRSEPARGSAEPAARQIWADAPDVSQGASPDPLEPDDPDGNAVSAPAGDRRSGEPEVGADDAEPDEVGRRDGGAESSRPIEVDRSDEHLQGASRGSDPRGTDLRVTEPVQGEQISFMLEAENAQTSSASSLSIPSELIDHVLRLGGNSDDTRMVLAAAFQKEKSAEEITEILRQEFHGGNGFKLDGADYSAWYADDGIHLAAGREAERVEAAQIISWQDAAARVAQLVESGEYATNVEIAEAYKHERDLLAEALLHLRGDLSDDARKQGDLSCLQEYGGSFPKALEKLSEALKDPVFQQNLSDEYAAFWTAYELDKNLLRFHYHKLREIWHRLKDLRLPRYELSDGMTEVPSAVQFITEDEISHTLMRGSGFAEGKSRIYAYFTDTHTEKEQADFLKKEYGVGGRTHAVSGASSSYEGSEPKGITLRKADCADVEMRWNRVAARISDLIRQNRYLTPEERAAYDEALAQDTVRNTAYDGYNAVKEAHPDDIVLYQVGDFFELYGEDARAVADDLSLELTRRNLEGVGRVTMCGFPANELEKYVEKLREKHDVTISRIGDSSHEHTAYTLPSIDHEAEKAINAYEAEFGADGTRVFRDPAAEQPPQATVEDHLERYRPIVITAVSEDTAYRNACGHSDRENAEIECNAAVRRAILDSKDMELIRLFSDVPEFRNRLHQEVFDGTYERLHDLLRPLSQDDIDDALRAWNGNIGSKHAVVRYMEQHGREKETAAWLAHEYGGNENNNLFIVRAGSPETVELTWPKVQRRLAQLIREDQFLTEQEKPALEQSPDYRLLDRLRADCEYFLGAGGRAEKHLWAGSVYKQIVKMRELYDALPQKPEWLTEEMIDDYADRMAPQFQVVAYHRLVNGFDEKQDYQTLEEAEKAAQSYADGTMESGGFAYDGAAVYDLREDRYCSIFGDYPDERAQAQVSALKATEKESPEQPMPEITQAVQNLVGQRVEIDGTLYNIDSADETVAHLSAIPVSGTDDTEPEHRTEPVSAVLTRIADQGRELTPNVPVYQALRAEHPEKLIGVRVGERLLFYGADAERAASALNRRLLQRDIPGMGETTVTGYDFGQWASAAKRLLEHGHSFVFARPDETGGYEIFNEADAKDYIPIGMELEIDGRKFVIDSVNFGADEVSLQDVTFQSHIGYPIFRTEHVAFVRSFVEEQQKPLSYTIQPVEVIPAEQNHLPYDVVIQTLRTESLEPVISAPEPEQMPQADAQTVPPQGNTPPAQNFRITDDLLGVGGAKAKFRRNMDAINLLKELEFDNRQATPEEQNVLSKYVGWGGLADAFDESKDNWKDEFAELYATLTPEEYAAARASTLNAHYTSPTVIKAIYETVGNMGFRTGNILEPSMGVGNFFGCLPETMQGSKLYGVELDSITGRIAKQLYPNANITVAGFETTDRRDFYDLAIGNVPFGQYQVNDRAYNKLGFSIHNYFFAKALDQVRPGGIVAFVTSRYTMDSKDDRARRYIAERAELLGAIRLPNNAFKANAGTDVVSDILFLQKRDRPLDLEPAWAKVGENADGFAINRYFIDHPEMILGRQSSESAQYGKQDFTVEPIEGLELADQLHDAVKYIRGTYQVAALPALGEEASIQETIPADPNVKNFSYAVVRGEVYYRENSVMVKPNLNATAKERVKGMVELRDCVQKLIAQQMDSFVSDETIWQTQRELNGLYDAFTGKYGLINSRANSLAFSDDSSYYLLCSLEILNENRELERKADIFTKRTIKPHEVVTSVDTASEALALSISEKACVDMDYMAQLSGKSQEELIDELNGVIFFDPVEREWQTADEYLSGNVREKLRIARSYAAPGFPKDGPADYSVNVAALEQAQPKDLDASEIEVRLGATWIDEDYIQQFMEQTFKPPYSRKTPIQVSYSPSTAEWNISGKFIPSTQDVNAYMTYGTERANAYRILEDTLNLRDVRIYDTTYENGVEKRVLNQKETTLAQQKQQTIKDAFQDWIWKDPIRRQTLVQQYNEKFNSTRPREYDGSHIRFSGMNPEITLREHQKNAIAHILYGGNTLLAHEVGAGKTFEMVAAEMESKRLGLCQKAMFVVPNHLTEQWASEFLRLYPSANILVTTKKDFETRNRKKFCARIATGDYDAVIIGHSQFEKIPISKERQERLLQEQIWEIEDGIRELQAANAERFTIKSLEKTKKSLEAKLKKLQDTSRKDDVITFEQLGIDRLYVDEAHSYKNLFLYTKMRNVAGLSATDAQKSSDMLLKCRYIDEITGGKGVVFATGTPVSNSMTELFTMMRYLQHDTLRERDLTHFDCWASTFGETTTAIELAPEGTGYRARTRFAKFFNLPELMNLFKEAADIKTADQLHLPTPTPVYHTEVSQPTQVQQGMVQELSKRAAEVHSGKVDAKKDNMLKITSDGRKLGLDQRIINPNLPDDPCSKVNRCVDNIFRIWQDGQADKLTQLVFCDLSTPKASPAKAKGKTLDNPELRALETQLAKDGVEPDTPFSVYDDIRGKLVAMGIPREQIAFIHEANTEIRKKELFSKVRSGQVRVLMGSTFKMGAGMNVQDRLIALHDLDCPWRPGDLEQRSGRIIRQGNRNKEVHIYRYVTEGTFDAYLWQTIENKQKFISQIMTSKSPVRSCEDIDETALSYAEIKALCAGDERIKEKMDLDVDVARLKLMRANHQSQQYRLEDNLLRKFPEQIDEAKNMIAGLESDMQTLAAHPHPEDGFAGMEVKGDNLTDKDNAGAALLEACKEVKDLEPVSVGSYRGFQMALTLENFGQDYILTLKGQMSHRVELGKDARGNLVRIDNALNAISERVTSQKAYLDNLYAQVKEAKAALGKPFPQEEELRKKSARLAELNAELNIDDKTPMERLAGDDDAVAKSARPSILQKLRSALPEQPNLKPKQKEMEAAL
jgi:N12 class adenine-specific DNA methylase